VDKIYKIILENSEVFAEEEAEEIIKKKFEEQGFKVDTITYNTDYEEYHMLISGNGRHFYVWIECPIGVGILKIIIYEKALERTFIEKLKG